MYKSVLVKLNTYTHTTLLKLHHFQYYTNVFCIANMLQIYTNNFDSFLGSL